MPDLNDAILEQLTKQNQLLLELVNQGERQAAVQQIELWHTRNSTKNETAIRMAAVRPLLHDVTSFTRENQLGLLQSVRTVAEEKLSFARFGDGELRLMLREDYSLGFQPNSPELAADLLKVYTSESPELLVGFPNPNRDVHWSGVWADIWDDLSRITPERRYGNSQVSRPSFFQATGQEGVKAWRNVWEGRDALIITGKGSRFDLIPPLFDNLASYQFVYSTPTDAYADLDRVLQLCSGTNANIALISLGPTGTILAARLAQAGIQAMDLGHISSSYMHAFEGGAWPESRPTDRAGVRAGQEA